MHRRATSRTQTTSFEEENDRTVVRRPHTTVPPESSPASQRLARGSRRDSWVARSGAEIGKYVLGDKLARGTFGVVFTAKDQHLDRDVAIKILNPAHIQNREIVQRFLQEARAAARIAHPAIVTMFDCGLIENDLATGAYIAMELLQGESLTARIKRQGRLAPHEAIEIVRQVANALDAAHKVGVLHRDLKPDNICLVPDPAVPANERVKVLDFGLAKLGGADGLTQMNSVFGTPCYMSPEQCRSTAQIDQRSDVYALGCILFELVTGRPPFQGSLRELVAAHQRSPIPRASTFSMEVTPALDDLIIQMLQKDPAMRPQTMAAVQRMLKSVLPEALPQAALVVALDSRPYESIVTTIPPDEPEPEWSTRWPRLKRAPLIFAAIAFVVAGALTALAAHSPAKPTPAVVQP